MFRIKSNDKMYTLKANDKMYKLKTTASFGGGGTKDYEALENKPQINSVELSGNKTSSDLGLQPAGNYALRSEIPQKVSELQNDSGFITGYTETDPTVPSHVKNISQSDITSWNGKADVSDIPDVSNFITKDVNNLTNYTLATGTGSSIELSINSSTYVVTLSLKNAAGTVISTDSIDLPLESVVVNGSYDSASKKVILTLQNGSTIEFSVADLINGLQSEITSTNKLDASLVDDSLSTNKFTTTAEKTTWNAKYNKPASGIPSTDLASAIQTSLGKADTALQSESDPVFSASASAGITSSDITNWNGKQDLLTAGANITIDANNVISATGGGGGSSIQYETMPTADSSMLNKIVEYVGATDSTYTNGYFYKCVSDGGNPATYSWENIDIEPSETTYFELSNTNGFVFDGKKKGWYVFNYLNFFPYKFTENSTLSSLTSTCVLMIYFYEDYTYSGVLTEDEVPCIVFYTRSATTSSGGTSLNVSSAVKLKKNNNVLSLAAKIIGTFLSTSSQTITGVKTFNSLPVSGVVPTTNNQLTNKKYVDDSIASVVGDISAILDSFVTVDEEEY